MAQLARALYGVGRDGRGLCTGTEAQDLRFSKKETRKATGLKIGMHWVVTPVYVHAAFPTPHLFIFA